MFLAAEGSGGWIFCVYKCVFLAQGKAETLLVMFMMLSCSGSGIYDSFQHNVRVATEAHGTSTPDSGQREVNLVMFLRCFVSDKDYDSIECR